MIEYEVKDKEGGTFLLKEIFKKRRINPKTFTLSWRIEYIDKKKNITELPWDLNIKSSIINHFLDIWPLQGIVLEFYLSDKNTLSIKFEDIITQEVSVYPFSFGKESTWLASLNLKNYKWNLKRLSHINY